MKTLFRALPLVVAASIVALSSTASAVVLTPTADTDVYQFSTYPTSTTYSLGINASNNEGHSQKSLIQFNATAAALGMAAADIGSAKLRLYVLPDATPGSGYGGTLIPGVVTVHPQNVSWTEANARWSTFSPGASLGSITLTQPSTSTNAVWVELDITALVKTWVTTPSSNHGIMIQAASETAAQQVSVLFASRETGFQPQLVVEKLVPKPFVLTSFTTSGQNVTLTWNSVVGKSYNVRESPDLTTWTTRQTVIAAGITSSATFTKTAYPKGKGFFRVETAP